MSIIEIQLASFTDNMVEGHEMTKTPYPFFVESANGFVQNQAFWNGSLHSVVGFMKSMRVQHIDLWWEDAVTDPQRAVGMYLVTSNDEGKWATHQTAVASVKVIS